MVDSSLNGCIRNRKSPILELLSPLSLLLTDDVSERTWEAVRRWIKTSQGQTAGGGGRHNRKKEEDKRKEEEEKK